MLLILSMNLDRIKVLSLILLLPPSLLSDMLLLLSMSFLVCLHMLLPVVLSLTIVLKMRLLLPLEVFLPVINMIREWCKLFFVHGLFIILLDLVKFLYLLAFGKLIFSILNIFFLWFLVDRKNVE